MLKEHLLAAEQILTWNPPAEEVSEERGIDPTTLDGIVLDELDEEVRLGPSWEISTSVKGFVGPCYHVSEHRSNVRYRFGELAAGKWQLRLRSSPHDNRCPRVAVQVTALGSHKIIAWKIIDQRSAGNEDRWHDVSEFTLTQPRDILVALYRISPQGFMIADAVQMLPLRD
ncbi:MAG: hypothetical protein HRU16_06920 [Planctomycetes bacterium]|nr:hypothetical protein [Planctomycetota bacterium]